MSALAASQFPLASQQPISELVATQEISRLTSSVQSYDEVLEAIFAVALAVPGVWRVVTEASPDGSLTLDRVGRHPKGEWGSAIAPIEAGLNTWGQLRISFEVSAEITGSPVSFAKYVAQQIAAVLDRAALRAYGEQLRLQVSVLRRRLETRKAVARAVGLVCRRDHVSPATALARIVRIARRNRRSLCLVAQSVVFLEGEGGRIHTPAFRRLLPSETTGSHFQATNRRGAYR